MGAWVYECCLTVQLQAAFWLQYIAAVHSSGYLKPGEACKYAFYCGVRWRPRPGLAGVILVVVASCR
jgi:hypothetical protein